ncbi:N-formylglutamate amidohydrolase [Roseimaritima multifibrata]|uniref:N-formylglutamate amidohydrolase n=1 Tax=Roseimaritima multifibrata TaxID=1930274 RepID=A0A517MJJ2_9BACT|nr:N-formylglutamate amidohydrolase [Roseimaritima multifibrata]QDS95066.1 N-formylglutamate amidohydrolase [Roseimaritima multifibrata]
MSLLISCENGGTEVPRFIADAFSSVKARQDLATSRGFDHGARTAATWLSRLTNSPLVACQFTRLAIDVNHSLHHRHLLSKYTKKQPAELRSELAERLYKPYRREVRNKVEHLLTRHAYVIHVAVRTFPPVGRKGPRRTDIGLAYDSRRDEELELCLDWYEEMYDILPWVRVRRNYPFRGRRDSLVKSLRDQFSEDEYIGVEIHLNQAWAARQTQVRDRTLLGIAKSLANILDLPLATAIEAA